MTFLYHIIVNTPLGDIAVQGNKSCIQYLKFADALPYNDSACQEVSLSTEADWAANCRLQLQQYFSPLGLRTEFDLPIDPVGTQFQKQVWQALCEIDHGDYASYQEVALEIGHKNAVRAVASAIARNPIWLIIPCHRIIGTDLALRGYAGGIEHKAHLLMLEGLSLNCISGDQATEKTKLIIQRNI